MCGAWIFQGERIRSQGKGKEKIYQQTYVTGKGRSTFLFVLLTSSGGDQMTNHVTNRSIYV